MPALPPVNQGLRVLLRQTLSEDVDVLNRFFMTYGGAAPSAAALSTWATHIATSSWSTHIAGNLNSYSELTQVVITDLTSPSAAEGSWSGNVPGTVGGTMIPASASLVITQEIARRFRGGHSRVYLTGFPQSDLADPQTWTTTIQAAMLASWTAFVTDVGANGPSGSAPFPQVTISYYEGFTNHTYPSGRTKAIPTLRPTPLVDATIGYKVNPKICSQRRRNLTRS